MSTALKVVWEDGVFKPKEPVQFEEHAEPRGARTAPATA